MEASGLEDIEREREGVAELARLIAELDKEAREREADMKELQAQKERQSGREVKDLAEAADNLSKKCVWPLWAVHDIQYSASASFKRLGQSEHELILLICPRRAAHENPRGLQSW